MKVLMIRRISSLLGTLARGHQLRRCPPRKLIGAVCRKRPASRRPGWATSRIAGSTSKGWRRGYRPPATLSW